MSLDKSVITGRCPSCAIYKGQLKGLAERTRETITDWERWAAGQDTMPPDDLLKWSRLTLEELDRTLRWSLVEATNATLEVKCDG